MKKGITQAIASDRLGLADLHDISDLNGDRLTVEPVTPTQLQVGDLLLFHDHGRLLPAL